MYCSKQDVIERFGEQEIIELTDRQLIGSIDDNVLEQAINDACAKIDGYIAGRYTLPLNSVPKVLISLACDITRFHLYDEVTTDVVTKRHDDAIAFLKSVSKGEVSLGISHSGDAPASSDLAEMQSAGSVFSRENGGSFI